MVRPGWLYFLEPRMKRLFVFIFFLIMTFHATADEVGNTTFVTEPKAEPLFTSKGGDLS